MWLGRCLRIRQELVCLFLVCQVTFVDIFFEWCEFQAKELTRRFILGGALGWKGRGDLDAEFEKVAFEMEASTTAKPKYREVKTGFGYHILMVEGRK